LIIVAIIDIQFLLYIENVYKYVCFYCVLYLVVGIAKVTELYLAD